MSRPVKIVVDLKLRRPACVLLQAAMGGDYSLVNTMPVDSWLLAPTPDMKLLSGTMEHIRAFRAELRKRYP